MKTQWFGICFSLTVHGMAACLIFSISQLFSTTNRTVLIDLSFDTGGWIGAHSAGTDYPPAPGEGSAQSGPVKGAGTAPPKNETHSRLSAPSEPPPIPLPQKPPESEFFRPVSHNPPPEPEAPVPSPEPIRRSPSPSTIPVRPERKKKPPMPSRRPIAQTDLQTKTEPTASPAKAVEDQSQAASRPMLGQQRSRENPDPSGVGPRIPDGSNDDGIFASGGAVATPSPEKQAGQAGSGPADLYAGTNQTDQANPSAQGEGSYLTVHAGIIRKRLIEALCYPQIARKRGWSGEVLVAFTVRPDGRVDDVEVKKSCGISLLDKSALKTVQKACPFPKPPMTARIIIPILYELK